MPKPYVKWSERHHPKKRRPDPALGMVCQMCGKELKKLGKYCSRKCHCTANNIAIKEWEHNVSLQMERNGWKIFRPASCCDRLGMKDGQLFFLEFKPQGRTHLREYQKLVRDAVPHMYRVIVGTWGEDLEITKIKGKYHRHPGQYTKKKGTSRFKGVFWSTRDEKWLVRLRFNGRRITIGKFDDEEEAARAYDRAVEHYLGPDAFQNFS
jgi:hypothetical protein